MKMCVFGLNHSNLSCGALPRAPGWLCRPTKPKPETRNPAAEWAKPETQAVAEKRNPKPKPGRNPGGGREHGGDAVDEDEAGDEEHAGEDADEAGRNLAEAELNRTRPRTAFELVSNSFRTDVCCVVMFLCYDLVISWCLC